MGYVDLQTESLFAKDDTQGAHAPSLPRELRAAAMRGSPEQRADYARSVSIEVPGYRMALRFMDGLLEKANRSKYPGGLWIVGDGGQGKTFVLQAF